MHAGNIYAALVGWLYVRSLGGKIVLRIEDLDRQRSKAYFIDEVQRDFENLGLYWDEGPYFQSDRDSAYQDSFDALCSKGLIYPCFCSRADLHAASAPHAGEKFIYAGTCRDLTVEEVAKRSKLRDPAWRVRVPCDTLSFEDSFQGHYGQKLDTECGDFLVRRSDGMFAYQLAVVVDDAAQGVNFVVRGNDLLSSTPQQIYLQRMLGLPETHYAHLPLLVGPDGRRLSKRNQDASLDELLQRFKTPEAVIGHIAFVCGIVDADEPASPEELLDVFTFRNLMGRSVVVWPQD